MRAGNFFQKSLWKISDLFKWKFFYLFKKVIFSVFAFDDGTSIISIEGCGDMVFDCESLLTCSINAQKEEDNDAQLCVKIGRDKACTTAGYGIAQI